MLKSLGFLAALAVAALAQNSCESTVLHTSTFHTTSTFRETLTKTETETVTLLHASAIVAGPVAGDAFYYSPQISPETSAPTTHASASAAASVTTVSLSKVPVADTPTTSDITIWVTVSTTIYATEPHSIAVGTASQRLVTTYYITETSTIYSTVVSTVTTVSTSAVATAFPFSSLGQGGWNNTRTLASWSSSNVAYTESLANQPRSSTSILSSNLPAGASAATNSSGSYLPSKTIGSAASSTESASITTTSVAPKPVICGESGNFTLNWDDEPIFDPSPTDPVMFPPVFNPYHHLFFSNGYAYAPPPDAPFKPISPPHMAVFLPNASSQDIGSPSAASARPGELGAGPRAYMNAYWFNIDGAYVGCDNGGPDSCLVEFVGFKYDASSGNLTAETVAATHSQTLLGCPGLKNCTLTHVTLPTTFTELSGLQIVAKVSNTPVVFWLDNLSMGWSNNTCEAGLLRQMSRK